MAWRAEQAVFRSHSIGRRRRQQLVTGTAEIACVRAVGLHPADVAVLAETTVFPSLTVSRVDLGIKATCAEALLCVSVMRIPVIVVADSVSIRVPGSPLSAFQQVAVAQAVLTVYDRVLAVAGTILCGAANRRGAFVAFDLDRSVITT